MKDMTEQELAQRRRDVDNAIGTQRLAGYEVDAETRAALERYARGEAEASDLLAWAEARCPQVPAPAD